MNTSATAVVRLAALSFHGHGPVVPRNEDRVMGYLLGGCTVVFLLISLVLHGIELPRREIKRAGEPGRITFFMSPESVVEPEPVTTPQPDPETAPELTPETVLGQAVDLTAPEPEVEATPAPETEGAFEPPRRVYGVRKVFARGLGAAEGGGSAIIVQRGNTLDGRADTLTATERDLRGSVAPLSTVTRAPNPIERHKPGYSEAMRAARVRGTVTARLLIDTAGDVRRVEIVQDIGYDSRDLAIAAFEKFRFEPALRGSTPVAVWITHKIRFEFQE